MSSAAKPPDGAQQRRWHQVEALFARAAALEGKEREELLARYGEGDPQLRTEVERLLSADAQASGFLEQALAQGAKAVSEAADPYLRSSLGPYRLVRLLGRGGIGSVYLGVRDDDQFRRRVAIKLIRRGMDTEDILRRFRNERQILASLDHPNIARLFDGGTTTDGLPYFVMEYIEGLPIDQYCEQQRLGLHARLAMFQAVCAAVHHAHRNLVVHRDLKPSNVLVTAEGLPKLLDFGIAKLLNPELQDGTLAPTDGRAAPMTPGYASPEQIAGEPITTASDIYSLGVLLHRLLTGQRPRYRDPSTSVSVTRTDQLRLLQPPERPSQVVIDEVPPTREGSSGRRGLASRELRGDLDTIVLMALRREPTRRYGSAQQLAEDISRHQSGQPVIARTDTFRYRSSKFIRRHRVGVLAALLATVLIMVLLAGLMVQSRRLLAERDRVAQERDRAAHALRMWVDMFEISDPGELRGNRVAAREVLDQGRRQIQGLSDDAETAALLERLAEAYENLGLWADSIPLRQRVRSIHGSLAGPVSEQTALASLNVGRAQAHAGDFRAAERTFRDCLRQRRQLYGDGHYRTLLCLANVALVLHDLGDYGQARDLYREGIQHLHSGSIDAHEQASLHLVTNLALLHHDMGNFAEAAELYRQQLQLRIGLYGRDHLAVATVRDDLAITLLALNQVEAAEREAREALEHRLLNLGEDHRDVARSRAHLGRVLTARGDLEAAEPLLRRSLADRRRLLESGHSELATGLESLAQWYRLRGDSREAIPLWEEALDIYDSSLHDNYLPATDTLIDLGESLALSGEQERAEAALRRAIEVRRAVLEPDAWMIAEAESALGVWLVRWGRQEEGLAMAQGSQEVLASSLGREHPRTLRVARRLDRLPSGRDPGKRAQFE